MTQTQSNKQYFDTKKRRYHSRLWFQNKYIPVSTNSKHCWQLSRLYRNLIFFKIITWTSVKWIAFGTQSYIVYAKKAIVKSCSENVSVTAGLKRNAKNFCWLYYGILRDLSKTWSILQTRTRSSPPPETKSDPSSENSMARITAEWWPVRFLQWSVSLEASRPAENRPAFRLLLRKQYLLEDPSATVAFTRFSFGSSSFTSFLVPGIGSDSTC